MPPLAGASIVIVREASPPPAGAAVSNGVSDDCLVTRNTWIWHLLMAPEKLTTIVAVVPVGTRKYHSDVRVDVPVVFAAFAAALPPIVTPVIVPATALATWTTTRRS